MRQHKGRIAGFVTIFYLTLCYIVMLPQAAKADTSFRFTPRANVGFLDYTLQIDASESFYEDITMGDTVPFADIGATFFFKKFYFDLYFLYTAKGNSNIAQGYYLEPEPGLPFYSDTTSIGEIEFYHWSSSVTVGYSILESLSLYCGYKYIKTSFDADLQSIFRGFDDGSLTGTPGFPLSITLLGDIDFDYKAQGPFIGGTYGFIIEDMGVLSFNLAVAFLEGEIDQTGLYINTRTGSPQDALDLTSSGKSIGLSYGFGWRGNISESLGYSIAFSGYNYDFENDVKNKSDFKEQTYQFAVGLSYVF